MAKYSSDYRGVGEMLRSPGMVADMGRRAELMRPVAVAASPVDTGRYVSSFETSSGVDGERAYGQLANTAPYAIDVEFGTSDTPAFAPLRVAMQAAG